MDASQIATVATIATVVGGAITQLYADKRADRRDYKKLIDAAEQRAEAEADRSAREVADYEKRLAATEKRVEAAQQLVDEARKARRAAEDDARQREAIIHTQMQELRDRVAALEHENARLRGQGVA